MDYVQKKNGKFNGSKRRSSWAKKVGVGAIVTGIIGGGVWAGEVWLPAELNELRGNTLSYKAEAAEVIQPMTPDKIAEMKNDVLDRLQKCESGGKETTIVFDSNGKASVGNYQWQLHSFRHYYKKMTGHEITERQAAIMALDDAKARELASYVIFDTEKGGSHDWVNCYNWHDLDTLIKFIQAHD